MSLETELRARLAADAGVSALVAARIYPLRLPQTPVYPALTYRRVSGLGVHNLSGAAGRGRSRIQVDCWAETYLGAQALAAAARASLDGFNGTLVTLRAVIFRENELDDFEDAPELYRVIQDWRISHDD